MSEPDASADLTTRTNLQTALLCSGIIGAILFTTVYFCFGVISPRYDVMKESITRLQVQPYGWIQSVNFVVAGVFILAFAIGLRNELAGGFGYMLIPFLQALTGLGCVIIGLVTATQLQLYTGWGIFLLFIISFLLLCRRFTADPQWRGWATYTILSILLMISLSIILSYSIAIDSKYSGIFERLIVVTRLVWLFFFTAKLLGGCGLSQVNKSEIQSVPVKI
jgi:hypothetical protein